MRARAPPAAQSYQDATAGVFVSVLAMEVEAPRPFALLAFNGSSSMCAPAAPQVSVLHSSGATGPIVVPSVDCGVGTSTPVTVQVSNPSVGCGTSQAALSFTGASTVAGVSLSQCVAVDVVIVPDGFPQVRGVWRGAPGAAGACAFCKCTLAFDVVDLM
jgi:hypothetical protein